MKTLSDGYKTDWDGGIERRIYKTNWNDIEGTPGIYLLLPGSSSVWAGFKNKKEAETCLLVLPQWILCIRK